MSVDGAVFDARQREAARVLAREDFYFFSRWMYLQRWGVCWQQAEHHRQICNALMRVYRGECRRLIINIPPRYSKTELAVVNFLAWSLGLSPDSEYIHVSYSSTLATGNSVNARSLVLHEAYRDIFPDVSLDTSAQHHWKTTAGGVVYATGSAGTITGFGAGKKGRSKFGGAIIIDDPHKADEALSATMRKKVIEWFRTTLESRKNDPKSTPIILIMQRLHEDDLTGWLLKGGNGEAWEHLCLSAWNDDNGDRRPLWPAMHSLDDLLRMEQASPYVFAGQYMQRPAPLDGGFFRAGRIEYVPAVPSGVRWVRAWDLAATVNGDYTVGAKLGVLPDGRYIIGDIVRLRTSPDDRDATIKATSKADGKATRVSIPEDPGQAGRTQTTSFAKMLTGYSVHFSPESGAKITRAHPFASQVNAGNVLALAGASWVEPLVEEMRMFPNGSHDDQIDALSRAFSLLISEAGMHRVAPVGVERVSPWMG